MLRKVGFVILLIAQVAFQAGPSTAANQSLDQLGAEILETLQSYYPVRSTQLGIHAYDHRFTDYSSKAVKQVLKKLNDFEKKLYKFKAANLPAHDRINYKLLKSNVDIAILDLKRIKRHNNSPQLYAEEIVNGVYSLILSNHAPLDQRMVSILNRMKAVPGYLTTARKNIKKPPPVLVGAAIEMLESGQRFYKDIAAELSNKFPERADELMRVSTLAREARLRADSNPYRSTQASGACHAKQKVSSREGRRCRAGGPHRAVRGRIRHGMGTGTGRAERRDRLSGRVSQARRRRRRAAQPGAAPAATPQGLLRRFLRGPSAGGGL